MMSSYPAPESLILVAIMNNPRDLEIARVLGWYRIPLRSAPKVVSVDFLAFYQTSAFKEQKWCIQYIAPVLGHELTSRAELLKDEANHPRASQEYFKIQIGSFVKLPEPIPADKWRRITFFYTTGEYLLNAKTVNDLIVHNEDRGILWQALRERAAGADTYAAQELPALDIDPSLLSVILGLREADDVYRVNRRPENDPD